MTTLCACCAHADYETSAALRRFRASGRLLGVRMIEALLAAGASAHTRDGLGDTPRETLSMLRRLQGCDGHANSLDQLGRIRELRGKPAITGAPGALLRQLNLAQAMLLRAESISTSGATPKKKRKISASGFPFKLPWE